MCSIVTNAGGGSAGGSTAGGSTAGGSTAGGSTAGGSTAGGSTAGGSTAGGSTAGGSTAGGSTAGGSTAGGSTAGGSTAGGSTAGGSTAGGSTAGGSTAGGSTAGGSTAGGSTAGPVFSGDFCENEWCWENPRPGLTNVSSLDFSSATEGWAVNVQGLMLRYTNGSWAQARAGDGKALLEVWANGNEAFAVGFNGLAIRISGTTVTTLTTGTTNHLYGVFGFGSNDVWFVGAAGTVLHWDGATVSPMSSTATADLRAVWGPTPNLVYAVGDSGTIRRFDGIGWGTVAEPSGNGGSYFTSISGAANDFVIAGANVFRVTNAGTTFTQLLPALGTVTNDSKVAPDGTIWVVGPNGRLAAWPTTNTGWSTVTTSTTADLYTLDFQGSALWAAGAAGEWLTRTGPVPQRLGTQQSGSLMDVAGALPELLAVGTNGLIAQRQSAGTWTTLDAGPGRFTSVCRKPSGPYVISSGQQLFAFTPPATIVALPASDAGTAFDSLDCLPDGTVIGVQRVFNDMLATQWLDPTGTSWTRGPRARDVEVEGANAWLFGFTRRTLGGGTIEACPSAARWSSPLTMTQELKGTCNYFSPAYGYERGHITPAGLIYGIESSGLVVRQLTDGGVVPATTGCNGGLASTVDAGLVCLNSVSAGSLNDPYTSITIRTSVDGGTLNRPLTWNAPSEVSFGRITCRGNSCWAIGALGGVLRRDF